MWHVDTSAAQLLLSLVTRGRPCPTWHGSGSESGWHCGQPELALLSMKLCWNRTKQDAEFWEKRPPMNVPSRPAGCDT